ncbi:hypothetical protein ACH4UM_37945 [Streptomyces sp. NPDC020801]|uniref:hypothetical protein n=1 Tax=Streptomyces sp. NPDC020801 TaxID=3365093 RepID=UPI00379F8A19
MTGKTDWWRVKVPRSEPEEAQPGAEPERLDLTPDPRDPAGEWWGNVYDAAQGDTFHTSDEPDQTQPATGGWEWTGPTPPPPVTPPQAHEITKEGPRQDASRSRKGADLVDAALSPTGWHVNRVKWCIYWASPALLGWGLRLLPTLTGWLYDCGRSEGAAGACALSLVFITAGGLIHWRTRGWWPPLAWAGRAPLSSALFVALLYAPTSLTH